MRGGPAPVRLARQFLVRARDGVQRDAQDRESATSGRGGVRRRLVRAEAFRRRAQRERVRQDKCGDPRGDIRLAYRVSRIPAFAKNAVRVEGVARDASRLLSLAREAEFENIAGVRLRALRSLYQTLRQRARDGARHSSAARLARDGHRAAHETDASTLALARGVHLVQVRRSRVEKRGMQRRRRGGGPHGGVFAELRRCEKHVVRRLEDGTRRGREPRLPRLGSGKKTRLARVRGDERHQVRDGSKRRHRRVGAETRGGGQKLRRAAYERARDVVSDVERRLRLHEVEVLHRKHRKHRGRRRPRRGNRERRVFGRRVRILLERDERLFDPDQANQSLRDGDVQYLVILGLELLAEPDSEASSGRCRARQRGDTSRRGRQSEGKISTSARGDFRTRFYRVIRKRTHDSGAERHQLRPLRGGLPTRRSPSKHCLRPSDRGASEPVVPLVGEVGAFNSIPEHQISSREHDVSHYRRFHDVKVKRIARHVEKA